MCNVQTQREAEPPRIQNSTRCSDIRAEMTAPPDLTYKPDLYNTGSFKFTPTGTTE